MLAEAKDLLKKTYLPAQEKLSTSRDWQAFAEEKYVHSLQVLGAGNYILGHEEFFINKSPEFIDLAKTVLVLHDIARFEEIVRRSQNINNYDHGVEGAKLLEDLPPFNDILITLPIKHHGHMIEDFYNDDAFKAINDPQQIEDVKNLIFLVRDADKIANFNQLCNPHFHEWHKYFFPEKDISSQITPMVKKAFLQETLVPRPNIITRADRMLSLLSWFYDINYNASLEFCSKLKIDNVMINIFKSMMHDNVDDEIIDKMTSWLKQKNTIHG